MSENMPSELKDVKDLKTRAYVLRRTNYGEADRILNLITPVGKIAAMAKGVRKEKSKLAGGIEMFTLSEFNLHFGKSDLATVTGVKMVRFYDKILKEYERMELAAEILKKIGRAAEEVETSEHFKIVDECLLALNGGAEIGVVETWFLFNLAKSVGEQVNLYTDAEGDRLEEGVRYDWDMGEMVLMAHPDGEIDADAIKIMRLMWGADLSSVLRVRGVEKYVPRILKIAQAVNKVVK